MRLREIHRLFAYDAWANRRLYEALGQLTAEEFTRDVAGSYGSVRNTLVHAATHAVHHRGQVALLVRALGHSPRNFDVLFFAGSR